MADRQDLLLALKVEDLRRKVLELAAIIGGAYESDVNPRRRPCGSVHHRRPGTAWRRGFGAVGGNWAAGGADLCLSSHVSVPDRLRLEP
jgi:hypothetical protein